MILSKLIEEIKNNSLPIVIHEHCVNEGRTTAYRVVLTKSGIIVEEGTQKNSLNQYNWFVVHSEQLQARVLKLALESLLNPHTNNF